MRFQTFGAWSNALLSVAAGALTQSPQYSFLALPLAITTAVIWLVLLLAFVYRNRNTIKQWVRKVGLAHLMALVGLGGIIVFAAIALVGVIWQTQSSQAAVSTANPVTPSLAHSEEYIRNATLVLGLDETQMPLVLGGT
jgi:hypothetical protein